MKKIIILLLAAIILSSCDFFIGMMEYEVTGSASSVDVTYANESGGTSRQSGVSLPWSYSFTGDPGDFVYILAENKGATGSVTATIYKNGNEFKTSTSSAPYGTAEASGVL